MGQRSSKSGLKAYKSDIIHSQISFDYVAQVKLAGLIQKEAKDDIKKKDLQEAYEKYRASMYIMQDVLNQCPSNYRDMANKSVEFTTSMMKELQAAINKEEASKVKPNNDLFNIVGNDEVVQKIIKMLKRGQTARRLGHKSDDPSIFLYGASGCGKTHLAKIIAKQIGKEMTIIRCQDMFSKYIGESEKKLGLLFQEAAEKGTCIFFDEIHSMFGNDSQETSEACERVTADFLKLMDSKPEGMVVLAATNEPWRVKATVVRRFSKKYYLELPDHTVRCALLKKLIGETYMLNVLTEEDIKSYATKMDNYSVNDIINVVKEAKGLGYDRIEAAEYFMPVKLQGGKLVFLPCESNDAGAIRAKDTHVPGKVTAAICRPYLDQALKDETRTLITEEHILKLDTFR